MQPVESPRIGLVDDAAFDAHEDEGGGHPERPERLVAAREGLYAAVSKDRLQNVEPHAASEGELIAVHDARYVRALPSALAHGYGHLDADTYFCPGTQRAAWLAAGGCAQLARALMRGDVTRGVALVRPPGHHAERESAMGFCLLNNVAVAAQAALAAGAQRVAIVDWDVHHGNGTQHTFEDDPRVLFVSLHQYPHYPGTGGPREIGRGKGAGYTVNVALPGGEGLETYAHAFRRVVLPVVTEFAPDLVLVSAGYDAHRRDPLAGMQLPSEAFGQMGSALVELAQKLGHGRVGLVLEGGYDLLALRESVEASVRALAGQRYDLADVAPSAAGREAVERTVSALREHWSFEPQ